MHESSDDRWMEKLVLWRSSLNERLSTLSYIGCSLDTSIKVLKKVNEAESIVAFGMSAKQVFGNIVAKYFR